MAVRKKSLLPPSSVSSMVKSHSSTPRMKLGTFGEGYARSYLLRSGYAILGTNVRLKGGEIDIVALDGNVAVFIEVKTRHPSLYGLPTESITPKKAKRMAGLAYVFMASMTPPPNDWQVDVIAIEVSKDGRVLRL